MLQCLLVMSEPNLFALVVFNFIELLIYVGNFVLLLICYVFTLKLCRDKEKVEYHFVEPSDMDYSFVWAANMQHHFIYMWNLLCMASDSVQM